jgi:hypothetical protein
MAQTQNYNIVEGPSKFELMAALFDGKGVDFTLRPHDAKEEKKISRAIISSCTIENDSRENWLIKGNFLDTSNVRKFSGTFNTKQGSGRLQIEL